MGDNVVYNEGSEDGTYEKWTTKNAHTGKIVRVMQCWSNYGSKDFYRVWDVVNYWADGTGSSYRYKQFPCPECKRSIYIYEYDSILGAHIDKGFCREVNCPST
jgi:hypothetical protein